MNESKGQKLFGVRVPVELHRRAKLEAVRRGISMAKLVEEALRTYLARPSTRRPA